jgi:hypothetical protein
LFLVNYLFLLNDPMKRQKEDDFDKKEVRRKKLQEKNSFKDVPSEPTISHSLKKEFKKKKEEMDEEEWEDWERYYNR